MEIPDGLRRNIPRYFGERGEAWLAALPARIEEYRSRWRLTLGDVFDAGGGFVCAATLRDGSAAVLKLFVPEPDFCDEIATLRIYDGRGAVRVIEADADAGALLLERITPGTELRELGDDVEATAIAAQVMLAMWRPEPTRHPLHTLVGWAREFDEKRQRYGGNPGDMPAALVARAEGWFDASPSMPRQVVLHGDLHHMNIMRSDTRGWLAIDAKGVIGPAAFETGAYLRNLPEKADARDAARVLDRRAGILSERLGIERAEIIEAAIAHCVLSAVWSFDGESDRWRPATEVAEGLASLG